MYHLRTKKGKYLCKNREFTRHVKFEYCLRHFPNHLYPLIEFQTIDEAKKVFNSGILGKNGCVYSGKELILDLSSSVCKSVWVDTNLILYGEVVKVDIDLKAYIHLKTDEYGLVKIRIGKKVLRQISEKLKNVVGINVLGKQNLKTKKLSKLCFVSLVHYSGEYGVSKIDNFLRFKFATTIGNDLERFALNGVV